MAAAIRSEAADSGDSMELSVTEEAALGLAHALFTGHPVAEPAAGALKRILRGVLAVRVSLVDKSGLFLLRFPIVEGGEVVTGSLKATAKCKEGTAAWTAFQTSRILSSRQLQDRGLEGSPLLVPITTRPGGFACLDWTDLKHHYHNCNIVTVPIEAPEGVLGALTGAAGPEKPEQDLTSEMQALSKSLAHSLTFCKCKSDLQAAVALLQRVCPTEGSSVAEAGGSVSEATTTAQPLPDQAAARSAKEARQLAAACLSTAASSCESFSDAAEGFTEPADMRHYHPPRIGPTDKSTAEVNPAERYCQWIHHNVHGQEQHSLASLTKSETPLCIVGPGPDVGLSGEVYVPEFARGRSINPRAAPEHSIASSAETAGVQASWRATSFDSQQHSLDQQPRPYYPGGAGDSNQTNEMQRPQQRITAEDCCGQGAPCGQWADIWAAGTYGGDIRTLGIDGPPQSMYPETLAMNMQGTGSEAVSVSGSEQISNYEPVWHRNRSSITSEWAPSRTSLGSPRDWQEDGDGFSEQPNEDAQPLPSEPDGQHMFQLTCGEAGCRTAVWLRPEQLGLEPVHLRSVDLQNVNLQSVELAPVSAEELRGQQTAHSGTAGWAAGQSSAQQAAETQALQRRSPPSAPSLHDWSAPQRQLSAETPFDFQDAATGSRRAPQQGQHGSTQAKRPMSLDQRWDLTFQDNHLESRFIECFNSSLLLADKVHCAILLLVMLVGIGCYLTADSPRETVPWILASGFLALVAAGQLAFLHGNSAALQCREQLASAERLVMPALTLFFCLSQASAQSQEVLLSYLSGWVSLAYLALARRLRLRAHLLLVMPELCMQATACMAGLLGRQDSRSLEQALSSVQGAQVLAAVLVPTAAVYILEQQARWRFLLNEIKARL